jgi:hypothetical protein
MAGIISTSTRSSLLNLLYGAVSYTAPTSIKFKLHSAPPTNFATGTGGTEITTGGLAPATVTNNTTNFATKTDGTKTNSTQINFNTPNANAGNLIGILLTDQSDNYLGFNFLDNTVTLAACATTSGSPTVTTPTNTNQLVQGCLVTGAGISDNTVVQTINSTTSITLSNNATATQGSVSLTFSGYKTLNSGDPINIPVDGMLLTLPTVIA